MHFVKVDAFINQLISAYYRIGFWKREDKPSAAKLRIQWFYLIYHFMIPIATIFGSLTNENKDDSIVLMEAGLINGVLSAKLWLTIEKQRRIFDLLEQICTFSVRDKEDFVFINEKLKQFIKIAKLFIWIVAVLATFEIIAPFVGEKKLFFKYPLPFDWEKNYFNFLLANAYIGSCIILSCFCVLISIIFWYVMFNCSLRYVVQGSRLTKLGRLSEEYKGISDKQKQIAFRDDLSTSIKDCLLTRELVCELESFCSPIFFVEMGTSGLCICGSIYCLAFDVTENNIGRLIHLSSLMYNVGGIFITTYLGNEIMLASYRLTYCLFKSDWIDQPQSTKMTIIILGECVRQPHQMVIAKLYPLTLESFSRILNFAYSTFNILKTFRT